jgi:hypothetical protein
VSPTIYREGKYRFFFNSREEERVHIHVQTPDGEAKFWLEPLIALAEFYDLDTKELRKIESIIREHANEFTTRWKDHFSQ